METISKLSHREFLNTPGKPPLGERVYGLDDMSVSVTRTLAALVTLAAPLLHITRRQPLKGFGKSLWSEYLIFKGSFQGCFNLKQNLPLPPNHFLPVLTSHIFLFQKKVQSTHSNERLTPD